MARNSQGIVDPLDFTSVLEQNKAPGTKITFIVPTDVTGQNDEVSVLTLKNQVKEAKRRLAEQGMREAEIATSLKPVTDLLEFFLLAVAEPQPHRVCCGRILPGGAAAD